MRCKNCGWENPANKQKCEKCNAPLSGSMIEGNNNNANHSSYTSAIAENLKGTIPETGGVTDNDESPIGLGQSCSNCGYPVSPVMNACPNCGEPIDKSAPGDGRAPHPAPGTCRQCRKPIQKGVKFCPYCGTPAQAQSYNRPKMGTVNAWESPQQGTFCTLKPIAWRGEGVTYNPISYSGTEIALNRANTDPNNQTITSREQAVLICEGGSWYIEDRSEQHTTLIRITKRTKLESGDVIVLGNRLFEFKD